jgi:hypothetical protein
MVSDQHHVVGFKVLLELWHDLWWKCTTSAVLKTNQLAMLMVKSGLDPHMTKSWNIIINWSFYLYLYCSHFILIVGWYKHILSSNYVANKTWPTKMIIFLNLSVIHQMALHVICCFPLAEYGMCSRVFILACAHMCLFIPTTTLGMLLRKGEVWRLPRRFPGVLGIHIFSQLPVEASLSAASYSLFCSLWEFWTCNNFIFLWHCFWYTLSQCMCELCSWHTRIVGVLYRRQIIYVDCAPGLDG